MRVVISLVILSTKSWRDLNKLLSRESWKSGLPAKTQFRTDTKCLGLSLDLGAYGRDIGTNIVELLNAVVKTIPEGCMMRIGMTNPPYILEHLDGIAKILNHPRYLTPS